MTAKNLIATALLTFGLGSAAFAAEPQAPYVRLADLEIDPAQLEDFNAAIKEGIEAAIRLEPNVLALYAVSEKDNPTHVRVFEVYTDPAAYQTHLQTPHFQKFRTSTEKMVKNRKLADGVPIVLGKK